MVANPWVGAAITLASLAGWAIGPLLNRWKSGLPVTLHDAWDETMNQMLVVAGGTLLSRGITGAKAIRAARNAGGAAKSVAEALGKAAPEAPEAVLQPRVAEDLGFPPGIPEIGKQEPEVVKKTGVPTAGVAGEEIGEVLKTTEKTVTPGQAEITGAKPSKPPKQTKEQKRVLEEMTKANRQTLGTGPSRPEPTAPIVTAPGRKSSRARQAEVTATAAQKSAVQGITPDTQDFWRAAHQVMGVENIETALRQIVSEVGTRHASLAYRKRIWEALQGLLAEWGIGERKAELRAILQLGKP
jgi:hypothetical protein